MKKKTPTPAIAPKQKKEKSIIATIVDNLERMTDVIGSFNLEGEALENHLNDLKRAEEEYAEMQDMYTETEQELKEADETIEELEKFKKEIEDEDFEGQINELQIKIDKNTHGDMYSAECKEITDRLCVNLTLAKLEQIEKHFISKMPNYDRFYTEA